MLLFCSPQVITLNGLQRETAVLLSNCQVASIFLPASLFGAAYRTDLDRPNKVPSLVGTA